MKSRKKKAFKKKPSITQKARNTAKNMGASVKETAQKVGNKVSETAQEAKDKIAQSIETDSDDTTENQQDDGHEETPRIPDSKVKQVKAENLKDNDLILDIRTHFQHAKEALMHPHWHIEAADVDPCEFMRTYKIDPSKTLYIICSTGRKSMDMAKKFIAVGYKNVASVIGGIGAAKEVGLKMIEHSAWNVQRQAYLTAGALILIGFLLSGMITKLFLIVPFLVGLCLTIQGLSGIALIDGVLEKMPWNEPQEKTEQ